MIPSHPPFRMWLRLSRRLGSGSRLFYNSDECVEVCMEYIHMRIMSDCCRLRCHVSELLSSPAPLKAEKDDGNWPGC